MSSKPAEPGYRLRPLTPDDLDQVVAIDQAVSGNARKRFFAKRLAGTPASADAFVHVGVTHGDALCGFAMAHVLHGEFGRAAVVAVLDALAVTPESGGRGVGRMLLEELNAGLRRLGVQSLQSQIDWRNHDLMHFFDAAEFSLAPRLALERPVAAPLDEIVEEA